MQVNKPIPKTDGIDHTLTLIKQGFHFLPQTRKKLSSDIFETRLMGKKAICMAGKEAAEMFYDNTIFKRKGAAPLPLKQTLLGQGGVHGLDGEQHKQRKRMHLSLITPERLEAMKNIALQELDAKAKTWENKKQVILFDELNEILTRAGLKWAGIPLEEKDVKERTEELTHMVDSFGGSVSRYRNGKRARDNHEKWLKDIIKKIRAGKYRPPAYTPAYIVSNHHEPNGKLLDLQTAAVELNNTYRPLLATTYWIIFGALALHQYPDTYVKMKKDENDYSHMFAQEVRRFYPFAPAMAAKVKKSFYWQDHHFKKDLLVVLDLYGTNMHEDDWESPNEFKPERFTNWKGSPFSFVPQGGGDHHIGHRCAGEWLTVMVMRSFFKYFVSNLSYDVPDQDLSFNLNRMPTLPNSHFIMKNVKRTKDSIEDLKLDIQTRPVI